jgi:multidrug efflux system membrane fusion protein
VTLSSSPSTRSRNVVLVLAFAGLLPACGRAERSARASEPSRAEAVEIAVKVAPVERSAVARSVRGTGVVRFKSEVDLAFKVGGVVTQVLVDEGARVKQGQLLARLDPTEVGAALRSTEEAVAKAERDLARVERLHAAGALPVVQRDDAETALRLARAAHDAAAFNAQRSAVIAPEDGRIERRRIDVGEVVAPGAPVFHLSGRSRGAVVRLALVDRDALAVREQDAAQVRLDARPEGPPLLGHVAQIATTATPGAGTFDVEIKLDAPPDGLLSGLTAKVELTRPCPGLVALPTAALVDGRGDRASVFVVEGGKARRVGVRVAFFQGVSALVEGGPLDGAAHVVETGAAQLEDGVAVRIVP